MIPPEATFSRAFAEFAKVELPSAVHEKIVVENSLDELIGHASEDSTAIEVRVFTHKYFCSLIPSKPRKCTLFLSFRNQFDLIQIQFPDIFAPDRLIAWRFQRDLVEPDFFDWRFRIALQQDRLFRTDPEIGKGHISDVFQLDSFFCVDPDRTAVCLNDEIGEYQISQIHKTGIVPLLE